MASSTDPRRSRPGRSGASPLRFSLWIFLGACLVVLDQATKFWVAHEFTFGETRPVLPFMNLVLAYNRGAAFSFLAGAGGWQRWLFLGLGALVVVAVIVFLWRFSTKTLFALSLTLLAAGATGNMFDRLVYGHVIDFLDFYWAAWHWPAFNVADTLICLGAGGIVLDELLGLSRGR